MSESGGRKDVLAVEAGREASGWTQLLSGVVDRWSKAREALSSAVAALPFMRFAGGLTGLAAALSISLALLRDDVRIAGVGLPISMLLLVALYVIHKIEKLPTGTFKWPLKILIYVAVINVCTISALATSSAFYGTPLDWRMEFKPPEAEGPMPAGLNPEEREVYRIEQEICALQADFEARSRNPRAADTVRTAGKLLARKMLSRNDARLDLARQIIKYEYAGWALSMVARSCDPKTEAGEARQNIGQAIGQLGRAVELMESLKRRYESGGGVNQVDSDTYDFIMGSSRDYERTYYHLAIAHAFSWYVGGESSREDVLAALRQVSAEYRKEYPPSQVDEFLARAVKGTEFA